MHLEPITNDTIICLALFLMVTVVSVTYLIKRS